MSFRLNQRVAFILLATAFLSITSRAHAADMFWSNTRGDGSGVFSNATHWSGGSASNPPPPNVDDFANFSMTTSALFPETYTVTFTDNAITERIVVRGDRVTFDLNGHVYEISDELGSGLYVSDSNGGGRLTLTDGTLHLPDSSLSIRSSARLTISTGAAISGSLVSIGENGTMIVQNGGVAAVNILQLRDFGFGGNGQVIVTGSGSTLTSIAALSVGTGEFHVIAGGMVHSGSVSIAGVSSAVIMVDGALSRWESDSSVVIGREDGGGGDGTLEVSNGGTFMSQDAIFLQARGTLRGNGHIIGNVGGFGVIAPGASAGLLQIDGSYTGHTGGSLEIEIGGTTPGTQHDLLTLSNAVFLFGSSLNLSTLDGFVPSPSDTFTVLEAALGINGSFANVANGQRLDTIDGLGSFLVHYGPASSFNSKLVVLSAFQSSISGDFDVDGDVDGNDFLTWQRGGSPTPLSPGELTIWRANFGFRSSTPAGAAVPEPTTLVLICLSAMTIRRSRAPCFR